jgi:hypothetical protein
MRDLEAKDFLVRQTVEQATLENVPLSDLEKRMMYFTETGECPEDPSAPNDSFEAAYDATEYEAKISKLMHHAYQRIRKENSETARRWKEATKQLSKGDHYLLILGALVIRKSALKNALPMILSSYWALPYLWLPRCLCLPLSGTESHRIFQTPLAGLRAA